MWVNFGKPEGLKCKMSEITEFQIYFRTENPVSRVHGRGPPGLRSTMDRRPLPLLGAHRSSASGRSGARELQPKGGRGGGRADELNGGVTAAREAVEGRLTGDGELGSEGRQRGCGEG
jgi:hypothetical protein